MGKNGLVLWTNQLVGKKFDVNYGVSSSFNYLTLLRLLGCEESLIKNLQMKVITLLRLIYSKEIC